MTQKSTTINRRQFVKYGLNASAGLVLFPTLSNPLFASVAQGASKGTSKGEDEDAHFFLMITLPDPTGLDNSYTFDSRPLEMTQKGIIQNYRGTDPNVWTGSNGVSTLATDMVKPLIPFRQYFSVLNGVVMDTGFDGHDQNYNYLFTGDPTGGECFIPHLNVGSITALDAVQKGPFRVAQTNGQGSVPLSPSAAHTLISKLGSIPALNPATSLFSHLMGRFAANSPSGMGGTGAFSLASGQMGSAFQASSSLSQMLTKIQTDGVDSNAGFVQMISQFFKTGAAKAAILTLEMPQGVIFDTHDHTNAALQPTNFTTLMSSVAEVFAALRDTPYDDKRSLFDVTTVMFSTEFGRTLRQDGVPIDQSGTNHNPLSNSILIGGKGIRGGQVVGSSDYASATETLSGAHLAFDASKQKSMGRPFDFDLGVSRTDSPTEYKATDYLGVNSIVNTIYSTFGVSSTKYRLVERNGPTASVIKTILA
jgi:hypothetical protein